MKKSLIALAALAAFGTASAQSTVTINGMYNFGFQKVDSGATSANFFDNKINFSGTEDLGGGLKASFQSEISAGGRADLAPTTASTKDSSVWGRNATMTLSGGFGTVSGGRIEGTNTIESAIVSGQSLNDGFDKAALTGAKSNFNTVSYTTPTFSGVAVTVQQLKSLNTKFAIGASATTTSGVTTVTEATAAATAETTVTVLGASYSNGPLVTGLAYKAVSNITGVTTSILDGSKLEVFATYDLGTAKLGLGYAKNSGDAYKDQKPGLLASVAVPMGAVTLGADWYARKAGGTTTAALGATSTNGSAYSLVANYALSKRSNLKATIGKIEGDNLVAKQQYRVGMYHTF
jgi:predicted porin